MVADLDGITKSLLAQPDAPCVAYRCDRRRDCTEQSMCCEAFAAYVSRGRVVPPTHVWGRGAHGKWVLKEVLDAPAPSTEIYARVFARTDPPGEHVRLVVDGTEELRHEGP